MSKSENSRNESGTTGELNIADFFRKTGKQFTLVTIEDTSEFLSALETNRVDAITQDSSDLVGKLQQLKDPSAYVLLPERLSKEPLAPAIVGGDDRWLEIINWTVYATIQAEEWGITQANVDEFLTSEDPAIQRFLGVDPSFAQDIGLDPKWAYPSSRQWAITARATSATLRRWAGSAATTIFGPRAACSTRLPSGAHNGTFI